MLRASPCMTSSKGVRVVRRQVQGRVRKVGEQYSAAQLHEGPPRLGTLMWRCKWRVNQVEVHILQPEPVQRLLCSCKRLKKRGVGKALLFVLVWIVAE